MDNNNIIIRPHRLQAVHTCGLLLQMSHVAWSVCLCVLDTPVRCAKRSVEPIEMPFGLWQTDSCGPKKLLDGVQLDVLPLEGALLRGTCAGTL